MAKVHAPAKTVFATKPQLAVAMIRRAIVAGVPFKWAEEAWGHGL
jgi:SRSO17 transposase